jgi:hypothetical protein
MPDAFDPYFKWLGIPKADQPPHAYRLLGIELFESDADVISNAADGRMAQIKSFQAGKYGALSQKLLNEIAAAKVSLLRTEKKAEYDRRLREQLQKKNAAATAQVKEAVIVKAVSAPVENDGGFSFLDYTGAPKHGPARPAVRKKKSARLVPALIGAGSLALVAGASYVAFLGDGQVRPLRSQSAQLGDSGRAAKNSAAKSSEDSPAASSGAIPKSTEGPAVALDSAHPAVQRPSAAAPGSTKEPKARPKPDSDLVTGPDALPDLEPGKTANAKPDNPSPADQQANAEEKPVKKPLLPELAQFQAMKTKILGIYQKEFAAAKTAEAKMALAAKLDAQADDFKGDPVERYSLWRMAADEDCDAGDVSSAMAIAERIQAEFQGDVESIKSDFLAKAAGRAASTPENARNYCETAIKLAVAAVGRDDYEAALRYAKAAIGLARRVKDPQFTRELAIQERAIEHRKSLYANVEKALEALSAKPDDPAANLTVGDWRCFVKGEWEKGLPYLAKGSRTELAALARREMAKPADARERVTVADGWWALAEKERDFKALYRAHAVAWYEQAAPGLSGLERVRVDKLLETAGQSSGGGPHASSTDSRISGLRGAVQKGNVALISNGATVSGPKFYPEKMINPADKAPTSFASAPCEFVVTLDKVYRLQQIRFLLQTNCTAKYQILVSRDGQRFDLLQDRSRAPQTDWQEFQFSARPVKAVKLAAVGPAKENFCIDQFEAYCFPIGSAAPRSGRAQR